MLALENVQLFPWLLFRVVCITISNNFLFTTLLQASCAICHIVKKHFQINGWSSEQNGGATPPRSLLIFFSSSVNFFSLYVSFAGELCNLPESWRRLLAGAANRTLKNFNDLHPKDTDAESSSPDELAKLSHRARYSLYVRMGQRKILEKLVDFCRITWWMKSPSKIKVFVPRYPGNQGKAGKWVHFCQLKRSQGLSEDSIFFTRNCTVLVLTFLFLLVYHNGSYSLQERDN